jgi:hypothetical protein
MCIALANADGGYITGKFHAKKTKKQSGKKNLSIFKFPNFQIFKFTNSLLRSQTFHRVGNCCFQCLQTNGKQSN